MKVGYEDNQREKEGT